MRRRNYESGERRAKQTNGLDRTMRIAAGGHRPTPFAAVGMVCGGYTRRWRIVCSSRYDGTVLIVPCFYFPINSMSCRLEAQQRRYCCLVLLACKSSPHAILLYQCSIRSVFSSSAVSSHPARCLPSITFCGHGTRISLVRVESHLLDV